MFDNFDDYDNEEGLGMPTLVRQIAVLPLESDNNVEKGTEPEVV